MTLHTGSEHDLLDLLAVCPRGEPGSWSLWQAESLSSTQAPSEHLCMQIYFHRVVSVHFHRVTARAGPGGLENEGFRGHI